MMKIKISNKNTNVDTNSYESEHTITLNDFADFEQHLLAFAEALRCAGFSDNLVNEYIDKLGL